MNVLPSTSVMRAPEARAMNRGVPPTALKARTGELTPPGSTLTARANSFRDFVGFFTIGFTSRVSVDLAIWRSDDLVLRSVLRSSFQFLVLRSSFFVQHA